MDETPLREMAQALVPDSVFQAEFDHIAASTKIYLAKKDIVEMPPTVIYGYVTFEGEDIISHMETLTLSDTDMENRYETLRAMGHKVGSGTRMVHSAFVIAEGWGAQYESMEIGDDHVPPSQRPDREEVVALSGVTLDQRCIVGIWRTTRSRKNGLVLGELNISEIERDDVVNKAALPCAFFAGFQEGVKVRLERMGGYLTM